ncbi:hypothetical protein NIES4101_85290 [Calothrix sp. NIES-4101]|nr:hypothetical protein NIES4101_85290 [Calothrix sp. NIES-4101]
MSVDDDSYSRLVKSVQILSKNIDFLQLRSQMIELKEVFSNILNLEQKYPFSQISQLTVSVTKLVEQIQVTLASAKLLTGYQR